MSHRFDLWIKNLKPETRWVYVRYLIRLFAATKKSPDYVLEQVKAEPHTNDFTAYYKTQGVPLDIEHRSARVYLEKSFTAQLARLA